MCRCVAGRSDRAQLGVTELEDLVVGERDVLEVDSGVLRKVCGRAGALDQRRQAGDVVGLNVRLEHRDDRYALRLRDPDVVVDEIRVRVDHREALLGLAAEQVGGTRRVVVEQLAEEHGCKIIKSSLE